MQIRINHLTRMQPGCICAAGIDLASGLHIRPIADRQLSTGLLCHHGGPLELAALVDLGRSQFAGRMPEIEDRLCDFDDCRRVGEVDWDDMLERCERLASDSLNEIFGPELHAHGRRTFVLPEHRGIRSLGCFRARRPRIATQHGRLYFTCDYSPFPLRVPITDIRLFREDHFQIDAEAVERFNAELFSREWALTSVGLSRPFRKSNNEPAFHWLQVNNILSVRSVRSDRSD